jgi:hypothetical protein
MAHQIAGPGEDKMSNYEYCEVRNRQIERSWVAGNQQQIYAVKLTPSGIEEIKKGDVYDLEGEKKTLRLWREFDDALVADGWMNDSDNNGIREPVRMDV